jgi:hypothetical protein
MEGDTLLLTILAIGTIVLNKDIILSEWFSVADDQNDQK